MPSQGCVGAIRKQNLSVDFIRWVFCFLKAALAAPVWAWKQWRSLCEATATIAFPVNRFIPIQVWVDSFTEAACQNLNHYQNISVRVHACGQASF